MPWVIIQGNAVYMLINDTSRLRTVALDGKQCESFQFDFLTVYDSKKFQLLGMKWADTVFCVLIHI